MAVFARGALAGTVGAGDSHEPADKACSSAANSKGRQRYTTAAAALLDARTWNGAPLWVLVDVVVVGEDRQNIHDHRRGLGLMARNH